MGCASSKRVEAMAEADTYRPGPASFAVFDVSSIEEPWMNAPQQPPEQDDKPVKLPPAPLLILQKLDAFDAVSDAPQSWSEVSKALEDLKPSLPQKPDPPKAAEKMTQSKSLRTVEELEAKLSRQAAPPARPPVSNSLKDNIFILRDREEREREGRPWKFGGRVRSRYELLRSFPEKCPPGGAEAVVLYTTTLRGVRRTFDDCERARELLDAHRVEVEERDVALHGEFLRELRELVGETAAVPRLFVKGRYLGGVEEVAELNESGKLGELLGLVGPGKARRRRDCEGCGGARFVLCLDCSGSRKVLSEDGKGTVRCSECNENGLVMCPLCH